MKKRKSLGGASPSSPRDETFSNPEENGVNSCDISKPSTLTGRTLVPVKIYPWLDDKLLFN
jgi:hypothetical protein